MKKINSLQKQRKIISRIYSNVLNFLGVITIIIICSGSLYAQSEEAKSILGEKVEELVFEKILNYEKESAKLSDFKGKIVILEFWATWCGSCIVSFPHLEELQQEFKNELQVLTITAETEERIKRFLKKSKLSLPIVIDTARIIGKQFPHRTIPHTVVLNKEGIIKIVSSPKEISAETIRKILTGEQVAIKEKKDKMNFDSKAPLPDDNALFKFTLTSYQEGPGLMSGFHKGRLFLHNAALVNLYYAAYGYKMSFSRMVWDVENKEEYSNPSKDNIYCLEIIAPNHTEDEVLAFLLNFLHTNFQLKSKIEKRMLPVKILKRNNRPLGLKEADPNSKTTGGMGGSGIKYSNVAVSQLAKYLESFIIRVPVIDETGLTGKYDIEIAAYPEDRDSFYVELEKLGFEVVDAEREIDMLVLYEEKTNGGI